MISEESFLDYLTTNLAKFSKNIVTSFHDSCIDKVVRKLQNIPVNHASFYNYTGCGEFVVYVVCDLPRNISRSIWQSLAEYEVESCAPEYFSFVTIGECVRTFVHLPEIAFSPFSYLCLFNKTLTLRVDSDFGGKLEAFRKIRFKSLPQRLAEFMFYDRNVHDYPMRYYFDYTSFGHIPEYNVSYPLVEDRFVYYHKQNGSPLTITIGPTHPPGLTPVSMFNSVALFWKPIPVLSTIQILPFNNFSFLLYIACAFLISVLLVLFLRNDDRRPLALLIKDVCFVLTTCVVHPSSLSRKKVFRCGFASFLLSSWCLLCYVIATMCKASVVAKLNSPSTNLTKRVSNRGFEDHISNGEDRSMILRRLLEGSYWVGAQSQLDVLLDFWGIRSQVYYAFETERYTFESYSLRCVTKDTNFGCRCTREWNRYIYEAGLISRGLQLGSIHLAFHKAKQANQSIETVIKTVDTRFKPDFNFKTIRMFFTTAFIGYVFGILVLVLEAIAAGITMQREARSRPNRWSRRHLNKLCQGSRKRHRHVKWANPPRCLYE